MRKTRIGICIVLVSCMAVGTTGCGIFDLFTLAGAVIKFASGSVGELNSSEWQIVTKTAADATGIPGLALSPVEADAIVTFFDANNVNTLDDIQGLADGGAVDLQGLSELATAFQARADEQAGEPVDFQDPQQVEEFLQGFADALGEALQGVLAGLGINPSEV
ncbi:MAG: hypothetical protein JXQ75_12900 [Phycisphaerae bacterium]|nr:hypothetical protein [Phycisphaerae bacterium]